VANRSGEGSQQATSRVLDRKRWQISFLSRTWHLWLGPSPEITRASPNNNRPPLGLEVGKKSIRIWQRVRFTHGNPNFIWFPGQQVTLILPGIEGASSTFPSRWSPALKNVPRSLDVRVPTGVWCFSNSPDFDQLLILVCGSAQCASRYWQKYFTSQLSGRMAGVKASRWRSDNISILYKNNHVSDDGLIKGHKGIQK